MSNPPSPPIRVLIAEDHELTRQGLVYGLGGSERLTVVAQAEDGQEAVALIEAHQPDVVLMDLVLPVLNGIQATRLIKAAHPAIKVLMLTSHRDQAKVFEAFTAGADGYCLKDVKTERLIQIIDMLTEGALWIDPGIAGFILKVLPLISGAVLKAEEKTPVSSRREPDLTAREKEILSLISRGCHNRDIAAQLNISLFTVKNHVSNIIQKLAVEDRTQAAIMALKNGLI
jgi:DNA-binding NarL/FixJ family response regulator